MLKIEEDEGGDSSSSKGGIFGLLIFQKHLYLNRKLCNECET